MALDNNIYLQIGSPATNTPVIFTLDDIGRGYSLRYYKISEAERVNLYVQNSTSKENPPVGSNRTRIGLERVKILSDGSERKVIVSTVISTPRDGTFTSDEINGLIKGMVGMLCGMPTWDSAADSVDGWKSDSDHGLNGVNFVAAIRGGQE
jgi:hypothetical protein